MLKFFTKRRKFTPITALALCVIIAGGFFGTRTIIAAQSGDSAKVGAFNLPIARSHAKYCFNVHDPRQVVGWGDYTFVGKVETYENTTWRDNDDEGRPLTHYTVTVLENIKGELETDHPLLVQKNGGITRNQMYVSLREDDVLPEPGNIYLFNACATEDGSLYCSAPNSTIPLEDLNAPLDKPAKQRTADEKELVAALKNTTAKKENVREAAIETLAEAAEQTDVFETYSEAYETEIINSVTNTERYVSKYDVSDTEHEVGEAYYVTPQPS